MKLKIELDFNFKGDEQFQLFVQCVRQAAKHMLTTAALLSDGRKPQIAIIGDDFFEGTFEVSLAEDFEELPESQEEQAI